MRPTGRVPRRVWLLLAAGLALQAAWHGSQPPPQARGQALPQAPDVAVLRAFSMGDPLVMAKLLMLWLQAFDNQPGISVPFRELDYARLESWLEHILSLDPGGEYPLLAASRLYAEVPDEVRQRRMLDLVHREFLKDPNRRWRWLAHGAIIAKHRLKDLPLALKYARAITEHATGRQVPYWARDMTIHVLEDMGELESARVLIGGLLADGLITDPGELRFLEGKLRALESRGDEISTER